MNKIAFEMWIIYCHWYFHRSFIRCNKIGNKLSIILCFQKKKKKLYQQQWSGNWILTKLFITTEFFYVKVSLTNLSILSNIVTVYFVSYKIGLVQPPTFQQKFSVGCFLELSQKHVIFVVNLPNKFSLIYKWKDT